MTQRAQALSSTILLSRRRPEITQAFASLRCLITGECICDACDTWDTRIVYEFGRCLVPSRFLQLVKEAHITTPRWAYVQPLYADLFAALYEDLAPEGGVLHSGGTLEDQACAYTLSARTIRDALAAVQAQKLKQKSRSAQAAQRAAAVIAAR